MGNILTVLTQSCRVKSIGDAQANGLHDQVLAHVLCRCTYSSCRSACVCGPSELRPAPHPVFSISEAEGRSGPLNNMQLLQGGAAASVIGDTHASGPTLGSQGGGAGYTPLDRVFARFCKDNPGRCIFSVVGQAWAAGNLEHQVDASPWAVCGQQCRRDPLGGFWRQPPLWLGGPKVLQGESRGERGRPARPRQVSDGAGWGTLR